MPKPEKVIMLCNKQRPQGHPRGCCVERGGGGDITTEFSNILDEKNLFGTVSLAVTGCLGPCLHGPIVAVMPDNVWYKEVDRADVGEIVNSHIVGGKPVERLAMADSDWG